MSDAREAELLAVIERLEQENRLLREKIDLLIRRMFGSSSEKLDPAQLLLLLQGEDGPEKPDEPVVEEAPRRSKDPSPPCSNDKRRPRLPEHLPVVETVLDPEPVKGCPEAWRQIGEEISEQLDYEPARFLCRRLVRRKYVRRGNPDTVPVIAPLPASLQERCLAAPGLIAQIIVAKYCDHLPLYRQEAIYRSRHDVWLPRQSMARWLGLAADWLRPIYEFIRTGVLAGGYVQVDETPIEYLSPGHGRTRLGYFWTCNVPEDAVFYDWQTSRAAACLDNIITADFRGVIQCDGYRAYEAFARNREVTLAGCWAHARRKFYEAREESPRIAGWILNQIMHLYRVESGLRQHRAGPVLREAERAWKSRPIVTRLHRALVRLKRAHRFLPQSAMGRAIEYALGQWPALEVWLGNGAIEIDNNLVENAIRPTAIGKKNWLFVGDADTGQRGAILYTLIENCRRQGIDPYTYLRDILTRLPTMTNRQIAEVTPAAWACAKSVPTGLAAS
jgi:transposase